MQPMLSTPYVDDLDVVVEQIAGRGLAPAGQKPIPMAYVTYRDPDGNDRLRRRTIRQCISLESVGVRDLKLPARSHWQAVTHATVAEVFSAPPGARKCPTGYVSVRSTAL